METKSLVQTAVAVLVAVVVVTAILVPIVGGSTSEQKVVTNTGLPFTLYSEDEPSHTIRIEMHVDGRHVLVDNEEIEINKEITMIIGATKNLRYTSETGRITSLATNLGTVGYIDSPGDWYEFNIEGRVASGHGMIDGAAATAHSINDVKAFLCKSGTMVMADTPYVRADSYILGAGVTYSPFSTGTVLEFEGTIDNLTTLSLRPADAVIDSVTVNKTDMYTQLIRIDSIKLDVTEAGSQKTATYTYFLAPASVTVDNPGYVGSTNAALLGIVPVLVIVGLILSVIGVAIARRYDL